jgi:hypothetical protein
VSSSPAMAVDEIITQELLMRTVSTKATITLIDLRFFIRIISQGSMRPRVNVGLTIW